MTDLEVAALIKLAEDELRKGNVLQGRALIRAALEALKKS